MMIDLFNDYDWKEAFCVAQRNGLGACIPEVKMDLSSPDCEDVEKVIAHSDGEADTSDWVAIFRLKDGRFISMTAWCDYTGWG